MSAGILIAIAGEAVDLSKISWYEKAPCGCVCGVHVAYSDYGRGPAIVIATAEQAAAEMWRTKHEREKYERLGFSLFADLTSRCKELLQTNCDHAPRFGIPERPEADGHAWAAVHDAVSRPKLMHLVPTEAIENAKERRYGAADGKPLCGGKAAFWWSSEWYALDGKVECSRCEKKATVLRGAA